MADQADPADLGQPSAPSRPAPTPPAAPAPDEAEFAAFYRDSLAALVAFLRYQGASWADAAELAQETMAEAFRSWSSIKQPKAWVRTVAGRKFHHRMFSVKETSTENVPEPSPVLLPISPTVEWEQQHEILRLIRLLPLQQRQVMAWKFDGFTPAEIAEALEQDPVAVRQNLRRARRKLADLLHRQRGGDNRNA